MNVGFPRNNQYTGYARQVAPYLPAAVAAYRTAPYLFDAYNYAKGAYGIVNKGYRRARGLYRRLKPTINSTVTRPVRRRVRVRKFKGRRGRKQLVKQVQQLSHKAAMGEGILIYRRATSGAVLAANNLQGFSSVNINEFGTIEAIIGQLRVYNPSAPSNLTQVDFTTGTYQRKIYIDKAFAALTLRNNYQSCVKVTVYTCKVKTDTNIAPTTAYTNGLTDSGNDTAGTNPLSFITDSVQFNDLWKILKKNVFVLSAGDEFTVKTPIKGFWYDASLADSQTQDFQRDFHSHVYAVFVQGILSHDSAIANEQGLMACGVDFHLYRSFKVKYDAGANIQYTYVNNDYNTPTNGFVQSVRPVPDNIVYSVA